MEVLLETLIGSWKVIRSLVRQGSCGLAGVTVFGVYHDGVGIGLEWMMGRSYACEINI